MSVPTEGDTFAKLMEHLRKAQEATAMLSHLTGEQGDRKRSSQWLKISELFRELQGQVTQLATRRMQ